MKKIIVFMGVPGSGKGTQAELIAKKYKYTHISTGDMLRDLEHKTNLSEYEQAVVNKMLKGELVPDEEIYKITFAEIENNLARGQGIVLDGAIRSAEQAEQFQRFFDEKGLSDQVIVIDISIPDKVIMERLLKRKNSGEEVRDDDNLETIKKRIADQGNDAIRPILYFYEGVGVIKRVNGERSIEEVHNDIVDILENEE